MKALYYPEIGRVVELSVVKTNDDSTVNLAHEGQPVVTSCQVTIEPQVGACVIVVDEVKAKGKEK